MRVAAELAMMLRLAQHLIPDDSIEEWMTAHCQQQCWRNRDPGDISLHQAEREHLVFGSAEFGTSVDPAGFAGFGW